MSKFTGNEGELVSATTVKELIEPFQKREFNKKLLEDNLVYSEFFGIHTFRKLMEECNNDCVGFRIYYGLRAEDHNGDEPIIGYGKHTSRLVIVPVDSEGNDILTPMDSNLRGAAISMSAMVGGPVCPPMCGK